MNFRKLGGLRMICDRDTARGKCRKSYGQTSAPMIYDGEKTYGRRSAEKRQKAPRRLAKSFLLEAGRADPENSDISLAGGQLSNFKRGDPEYRKI